MSGADKGSGKSGKARYLVFNLGGEEYSIPLLAVKEVIALPEVTPVPFSPAHTLGIMNLRGQIISVIDLRLKLGMKPRNTPETSVIICDLPPFCIGVVVDSITSVFAPTTDEIADPPTSTSSKHARITQVFKPKGRLILCLDIGKSLDLEDLKVANQVAQGSKPGQAA